MRPGRLDRYLLTLFLARLGLTVSALLALYLAIDLFEKLRLVNQRQLPLELVLRFLWSQTPLALSHLLPLAGLFASALTVTTLARRHELTALRAAGIAPPRALAPLLIGGVITAATQGLVGELWLPATLEVAETPGLQALSSRRSTAAVQWYADTTHRYRVAGITAEGQLKELEVITIDGSGRAREHLLAARARWDGRRWIALEAAVWKLEPHGSARFQLEPERPLEWDLPPERMASAAPAPERLSFEALEAAIEQGRASGRDVRGLTIAKELRRLLPFSCLLLVLMGISRGASPAREARSFAAIAEALAIGLAYLLTTGVSLLLVQRGFLGPLAGLWVPQGIWLAVGLERMLRLH